MSTISPKTKLPPVGVTPYRGWIESRINDLLGAISRYKALNDVECPDKWDMIHKWSIELQKCAMWMQDHPEKAGDKVTTSFNINEQVHVVLTDYGKKILREKCYSVPVNEDGTQTFQLWELMHIFGSYFYLGARPDEMPFYNGTIFLEV